MGHNLIFAPALRDWIGFRIDLARRRRSVGLNVESLFFMASVEMPIGYSIYPVWSSNSGGSNNNNELRPRISECGGTRKPLSGQKFSSRPRETLYASKTWHPAPSWASKSPWLCSEALRDPSFRWRQFNFVNWYKMSALVYLRTLPNPNPDSVLVPVSHPNPPPQPC